MTNSSVAFLDTEFVYSSNPDATSAVTKSCCNQLVDGEAISIEWSIDDHLLALRTRVNPLCTLGEDVLSGATHAHKALWLDSEAPPSMTELGRMLKEAESEVRKWRKS